MTTDELDLLRSCRAEPDPPSDETRDAARQALARAMLLEVRAPLGGRAWGARRHRGRRPRPPAIVAAALAAVALLVPATGVLRSGTSASPALAAGPLLERLARVAAAQPATVPRPGQYLYSATRSLTGSDVSLPGGLYCQAVYEQYRETWIAANGEGLLRTRNGPVRYRSHREAVACRRVSVQSGGTSSTWNAPGCMSIDPIPLGRLPEDPGRLRARLLTGKVEGGPPGPGEAFTQVGDLLRETDASPALRAALYRAAAGLAGVRSLGAEVDKLGRRGVGLAFTSHGTRHELIFSATTGKLMAEQDVLVGRAQGVDAPRGTVLDWSVLSGGRVVDRLPAPSPLPLTPPCIQGGGTGLRVPGRPLDSVTVGASARSPG
jgi:hypothetical protein